ncbi:DNA repair protein RAD57 [Cladophialophora carrionii]|uniref:DNA repair protein RAD57 n=1 Tax=Cladophialophora carrionii TaxID=86049 RepID=A0A1C1C9E4_9EURO|nr:DNA repair protein RAD57 [Cladophialophora carrionii]
MDLAGPVPELQSHTGPTSKPDDAYLSDFTRLGEQTYYNAPTTTSRSTPTRSGTTDVAATAVKQSTPDPDLIIICSWMYALPRHIAKYTQAYRARYASSPILLLRQDGGDFFWRTHATQMRNLEPAVSVIRTLERRSQSAASTTQVDQNANPDVKAKAGAKAKAKTETKAKPRVLMHVFSNGGAWSACQLADAYASAYASAFACTSIPTLSPRESDRTNAILPVDALILDSTPSLPDPRASHAAICEALPNPTTYPLTRKVGETAVWCFLALASGVDALLGREHLTLNIRRRLNDPEGAFMQSGLRRVYIYSETDALIPASDVELHSEEARASASASARARVTAREKAEIKENKENNEDGVHETSSSTLDTGNDNGDNNTISDDGPGPHSDADTRIWLEKFEHTRHVGHMQGDPGRYWAVVERVWTG